MSALVTHGRKSTRPWAVLALCGACLLSACDSGSSPSQSRVGTDPLGTNPPTSNQSPTISGDPPPMVMQGTKYSFVPSADDPDGDSLIFFVVGLPSWATFDAESGLVTGTPGAGDIGVYPDITIGVSDGQADVYLTPYRVEVVATALGTVTLSWASPTTRSDGSPLVDLAGFRIFWGMDQGDYSNSVEIGNPGISSYVVEQLTPGRWFFTMSAFDSTGVDSPSSGVASTTI